MSTSEQSLDLQVDALLHEGIERDLIFTDKMSGATMKRPGLVAAFRIAQHTKCDFVVWKLDRLGRTTLGILTTIEMFSQRGVNLVSLTEPFDLSTPTGRMLVTQLSSFAQLERDLIRERTLAGLARAREKGLIMGRSNSMTEARRVKAAEMVDAGSTAMEVLAAMKEIDKETSISRARVYQWIKDYKIAKPDDTMDDL